jgi:pimeloyl-ACP methyl ester carboxylesterase
MPTRHGPSHVLIAGPPQATPIVCLHAMRTGSAHLLSELPDLVRRFRLIAPDLPDQSVRGLQLRLPMAGHAQADWLQDILDGFGLDQVNLFGVSWGGFVARQTASAFPTRIRRLALLVPAGIANGSHWKGLTKMAWPLLRYRLRRTDQNLRRLLEPLITTWDVDWSAYMADTLRYLRTDLRWALSTICPFPAKRSYGEFERSRRRRRAKSYRIANIARRRRRSSANGWPTG